MIQNKKSKALKQFSNDPQEVKLFWKLCLDYQCDWFELERLVPTNVYQDLRSPTGKFKRCVIENLKSINSEYGSQEFIEENKKIISKLTIDTIKRIVVLHSREQTQENEESQPYYEMSKNIISYIDKHISNNIQYFAENFSKTNFNTTVKQMKKLNEMMNDIFYSPQNKTQAQLDLYTSVTGIRIRKPRFMLEQTRIQQFFLKKLKLNYNKEPNKVDLSIIPFLKTTSLDEDHLSCKICFVDYEEKESLQLLPCTHRFHVQCFDRWKQKSVQCPICQHDSTKNSELQ